MKYPLLLMVLLSMSLAAACGSGAGPKPTPAASATAAATTTSRGGGAHDVYYATLADVAHHYRIPVFAPVGVPVGPPAVFEDPPGVPLTVHYSVFGDLATAQASLVRAQPPASAADYSQFTKLNPTEDLVRRTLVSVRGAPALLVETQFPPLGPPGAAVHDDRTRLLWSQGGYLLQIDAFTSSSMKTATEGGTVTAGPDALVALADAMVEYSPATVDAAAIQTLKMDTPPWGDQWSVFSSRASAEASYGAPLLAPPSFSSITVIHAGALRSYTIDLDAHGARRLFRWPGGLPAAPTTATHGLTSARATVGGRPALYERVQTAAGPVSSLFFSAGGRQFLLRDASGGTQADLEGIAGSVAAVGPAAASTP